MSKYIGRMQKQTKSRTTMEGEFSPSQIWSGLSDLDTGGLCLFPPCPRFLIEPISFEWEDLRIDLISSDRLLFKNSLGFSHINLRLRGKRTEGDGEKIFFSPSVSNVERQLLLDPFFSPSLLSYSYSWAFILDAYQVYVFYTLSTTPHSLLRTSITNQDRTLIRDWSVHCYCSTLEATQRTQLSSKCLCTTCPKLGL